MAGGTEGITIYVCISLDTCPLFMIPRSILDLVRKSFCVVFILLLLWLRRTIGTLLTEQFFYVADQHIGTGQGAGTFRSVGIGYLLLLFFVKFIIGDLLFQFTDVSGGLGVACHERSDLLIKAYCVRLNIVQVESKGQEGIHVGKEGSGDFNVGRGSEVVRDRCPETR